MSARPSRKRTEESDSITAAQLCDRFLEAGWLTAAALIPLYINFFSTRGYSAGKAYLLFVIVVLMAGAWLVRLAEGWRDREFRAALAAFGKSPLPAAVATYALAVLVATVTSVSPGLSFYGSFLALQGASTTLIYIVFFGLLALNLKTQEQCDRLITVSLFATIPVSVYAVAQELGWDPLVYYSGAPDTLRWRVRSTMGNHLFLGAYLVMVLPWTGARLFGAVEQWRQTPGDGGRSTGAVFIGAGSIIVQLLALGAFLASGRYYAQIWWMTLPVLMSYLLLVLWTARLGNRIPLSVMVVAYAALLTLQTSAVAFTQARGPWLAALAGMGLFGLLVALCWRMRRLLLVVLGSVALICGFIALLNLPGGPLKPLKRYALLGRLGSLTEFESGSISFRFATWQSVGRIVWSRPDVGSSQDRLNPIRPLVGYGPETLGLTVEKVLPPSFGRSDRWQRVHAQAHNELLQHLAETGLLGLGAYLLALAVFYYVTCKALWKSDERSRQLSLIALISAMTAHLVELQFGVAITATRLLFWLFLALAVFLSRALPQSAKNESRTDRSLWRSWTPRYLLFTLILVLIVATAMEPQAARTALFIGFMGLMLGMVLLAMELGPAWGKFQAGSSRLWVAAVVGGLACILIYYGSFRPLVAHAFHTLGQVTDQTNRIIAYQWAAAAGPREATYHAALGNTLARLGFALLKQRPDVRPPQAFNATSFEARMIRPQHFAQLGGDGVLALAEASLQEARRLQPLNPRYVFDLAQLNHQWGLRGRPERLDAALRYYREAQQMSPNRLAVLVNLGLAHVAKREPERALDQIRAAQSLGYDSWLIHHALAALHRQLGNTELALKEAELAARMRGRKEKAKRLADQPRDQGESLPEGAGGN